MTRRNILIYDMYTNELKLIKELGRKEKSEKD